MQSRKAIGTLRVSQLQFKLRRADIFFTRGAEPENRTKKTKRKGETGMSIRSFVTRAALLVAVFFLVLSLIFSTFDTYAWYTPYWTGARLVSSTAAKGDDPFFYAWIYDVTNENTGETILENTGAWRNIAVSGTGDGRTCQIQKATERGITNSEKYVFTSMHLGTVDNLISLSRDNYMYLRFDIDDLVRQGRKLRLGYSIARAGVHFYDLTGTDKTSELTAQTLDEFIGLVNVEYAVSTAKYDPTVSDAQYTSMQALFSSDNTLGYGELTNGAALTDVFAADRAAPYVLYLRFFPDLQGCFDVTEFLGTYMPCETLFDLDLTLEFYEIHV